MLARVGPIERAGALPGGICRRRMRAALGEVCGGPGPHSERRALRGARPHSLLDGAAFAFDE